MKLVVGDPLSVGPKVSLAHGISQDCKLKCGIARKFRKQFGRIREIKACRARVGGVAVLKVQSKFIYNLVVKDKFSDKPTYTALVDSLREMKRHALTNGVRHIAMPKVGCGSDGLEWSVVRALIRDIFSESSIQISIYMWGWVVPPLLLQLLRETERRARLVEHQ